MYYCDVAVIGGGASGLAAAIECARGGAFVYILERLNRVGKKLLVTGNGKCNLDNRKAAPCSYPDCSSLFSDILTASGSIDAFFSSLGLYTRSDSEGRAYPMSAAASSVLDALRLECSKLGAAELCSFKVTEIAHNMDFIITSEDGRRLQAKRVIFAFGGKAAPSSGTDGSGFKLLSPFNIRIKPLSPALAPLKCSMPELRALKGLRVNAKVTAFKNGKPAAERTGEVQFGDALISGICVFDLAYYMPDELSLDIMPEFSLDELRDILISAASVRSSSALEDAFTGLFNKRVAQVLLRRVSPLPLFSPCSELDRKTISSLASTIKDWRFPVSGSDWEKAQVTKGGIPASELSPSLELIRLPGAYACGEALDITGPCGGYNLHWAWVSGRCAGKNAAESLR